MVDILLSTYNGEAYLGELRDSLASQSGPELRILARDDGSSDATPSLLEEWRAEDGRVTLLSGPPSGSASGGFFALLKESRSEYAMFCDQDDVWHADKTEKSFAAMKKAEERWGRETPLLVFTDLRVVDARLREIAPSMMELQQLCPEERSYERILCQSLASGCTMMLNAPLRSLVLSALPEHCLMYDWWISLAAAACGQLVYLPEATIDYRQHGNNQVGAQDARSFDYLRRQLARPERLRGSLYDTCEQAAAFAALFRDAAPADAVQTAERYAALPKLTKAERIRTLRELGTLKVPTLRRMGQYIFI